MGPTLLRDFKINEIASWTVLRFAEETEAWDSVERLLADRASERDLVALKRKLQNPKEAVRVANDICRRGCNRLLKFALAERPSLVDAQLPQRRTLLHVAAEAGNLVAVRYLVDTKANVNAKDQCGLTPLHEAAAHCSYYVLLLLLKAGADANTTDEGGRTALHYAARGGSVSAIQVLLSEGLRSDAVSASGWTPLHEAAGGPNPQCVFLLMEAGADRLATTAAGWTALHAAASSGISRTVRILLDASVPVDAKTLEEETALHFAAERNANDVVSVLAEAGADLEAVDKRGRTPSRRAAERQLKEQAAAAKVINQATDRQTLITTDDTVDKNLESGQGDVPRNMPENLRGSILSPPGEKSTAEPPQIVPSYDSEVSYGDDISEYSYLSGESYSESSSESGDECSSVGTASEKFGSYEHLPTNTVLTDNSHSNYQNRPHTPRGMFRGRGRGNFRVKKSASRESGLEQHYERGHTKHRTGHHHEVDGSEGNIPPKHRHHHRHHKQHLQHQPQQQQQQRPQQYQQQHQQPHQYQQQQPQQHKLTKKQYKQQHNQQDGRNKPKTSYKQGKSGDNGAKMENRIPNPVNRPTQNQQMIADMLSGATQFAASTIGSTTPQSGVGRPGQDKFQKSTSHFNVLDDLEQLKQRMASIDSGSTSSQNSSLKKL